MKFEWDEAKNRSNRKKHGVSFEEAAYVFADPFAVSIPDDEHSAKEDRWILLGRSRDEKTLVVVHVFRYHRSAEFVRLISARKATSHERAEYEKGLKQ